MERDNLLLELTALDFMAVDLCLYLDTHPGDCEALAKYNECVILADQVRCEYEAKYGPLCSFRSYAGESYRYIDDPWPWCASFNFNLPCEEEEYANKKVARGERY